MQPKPKSAPAGRLPPQSRLAKTQSEAMKEMQAWARRAEEPGMGCHVTRMSGQLTDNVTEERMLRAKLWELSKERYKFLLQNAYEKKLFADRMQRKRQAMLRARANSAATFRSSPRAKPRPLTTSAITHPRPFTSSTNSCSRPLSTSTATVVRSQNTSKPTQLHPPSVSRTAQVRPLSTSTRSFGGPVSTSKNDEAVSRSGDDLRSPQHSSTHSAPELPVDHVQRNSDNAEQASAETANDKDSATSEENNRMREVEKSWVMSRGRGKVTPAATAISILPPAVPNDGDGRMVLAPLQNAPPTPPAVSHDGSQAKPPSSPPPVTASRNVHFSRMRGWKSATAQRTSQGQSLTGTSGQQPSKLNTTTSSGVLLTRRPSESGASSKPTSASSKRSAPWSTAATITGSASLLGRKRGLLHRYGMRLESKTSDPRYTSLEHSLTPVPDPRVHTEVSDIVQSFDALRMRPKLRKDSKPKTGFQVLNYMNERGFVF